MMIETLVRLFLLTTITCKHYLVEVEAEEEDRHEEGSDYYYTASPVKPPGKYERSNKLFVKSMMKEIIR